jgi:hypothetical protein
VRYSCASVALKQALTITGAFCCPVADGDGAEARVRGVPGGAGDMPDHADGRGPRYGPGVPRRGVGGSVSGASGSASSATSTSSGPVKSGLLKPGLEKPASSGTRSPASSAS